MSASSRRVWLFVAMLISVACRPPQSSGPQPTPVDPSRHRSTSAGDMGIPHFAGVDIVPTSRSGFRVRIHGGVVGDAEPLYVIDGAPMKVAANRGIDWFTPEQIADIKVLKFPHELAEYGLEGANGVVVITTKGKPGQSARR